MRNKIHNYFGRFGSVESVKFHSKGGFYYGFVQFKMAKCAEKALLKKKHRIGNRIVKVKMADFWHQPDVKSMMHSSTNKFLSKKAKNPLLTPPDQSSPSHILNSLDDDCLHEVLKYLRLRDLCKVAEVCVRFKQIATQHFKTHHTQVNVVDLIEIGHTDDYDSDESEPSYESEDVEWEDEDWEDMLPCSNNLKLADHFFRNFGSMVKHLILSTDIVDHKNDQDLLLKLTATHCTSLTNLELVGLEVRNSVVGILCPLFASLTKLTLKNLTISNNFGKLLSVCGELKSLRLDFILVGKEKWLRQSIPKLEALEINLILDLNELLNPIMALNENLKALSITLSNLPSSIFKTITHRLPRLESLLLHQGEWDNAIEKNIQHLTKLKSLKILKLNFKSIELKPLVDHLAKENVPIEQLSILHGTVDKELITSLLELKSLENIGLYNVKLTKGSLTDLAKRLTQLAELSLNNVSGVNMSQIKDLLPFAKNLRLLKMTSAESDFRINTAVYDSLLHIVKNRSNRTKLAIQIVSNRTQISMPRSILAQNRYWLEIKETVNRKVVLNHHDDSSSDDDDSDDEGVHLYEVMDIRDILIFAFAALADDMFEHIHFDD